MDRDRANAAPASGDDIRAMMERIPQRIVVFSGKGGVGKTTVAVNIAYALAGRRLRVGLLDADITGPNVAQMTGVNDTTLIEDGRIRPHERFGVKLVSLATMLPPGEAVIWRGPMRSKVIEQLLGETAWGDLDVLVVDLPPGTGDEVLTIAHRVAPQAAIVVTTPQEVALIDARRAVQFARRLEIPQIGIVENMSGFACPHCGERIDMFGIGAGRACATALDIEFLGAIPLDPALPPRGDAGRPIVLDAPDHPASIAFREITARVTREESTKRGQATFSAPT